jgi:hypothetical protein
MATCVVCNRALSSNPNELENIIECRYCGAMTCSQECASEHELQAHPNEALPLDDEAEP